MSHNPYHLFQFLNILNVIFYGEMPSSLIIPPWISNRKMFAFWQASVFTKLVQNIHNIYVYTTFCWSSKKHEAAITILGLLMLTIFSTWHMEGEKYPKQLNVVIFWHLPFTACIMLILTYHVKLLRTSSIILSW